MQLCGLQESEAALKKEAGLTDSGVADEFLEFKAYVWAHRQQFPTRSAFFFNVIFVVTYTIGALLYIYQHFLCFKELGKYLLKDFPFDLGIHLMTHNHLLMHMSRF